MEKYTIKVLGEEKIVPEGTTFLNLACEYQDRLDEDIAVARHNGKLVELFKEIKEDGEVDFITVSKGAGLRTYRRTTIMLMHKAIYEINRDIHAEVMFNVDQGAYCEFQDGVEATEEFLQQIKGRMEKLAAADIPIVKTSIGTDEAVRLFTEIGMPGKGNLFKYRTSSKVNVYSMGEFVDYYYGYMLPSTGYIKAFDIKPYKQGFVLLFPYKNSKEVAPFNPSHKLFDVMMESTNWGKALNVTNIGELNDAIAAGRMQEIILVQEALMETKISDIAARVVEENRKFVMIAGPSSSGKTSFSHRLSVQLKAQGKIPHPVGLDNFYRDRRYCPVDEDGKLDFECLEALDVALFNDVMTRLLAGETVEMPTFNFKTGMTEYKGDMLTLGKDDILVIEGIHGLNDKLSYSIAESEKFKIYISALTVLNIDEHNCIHTTDGRLLRRIVRDNRSRATRAEDTMAMWASVRRGEENYIFPNQESADAMFNSNFIYELAVIKPYVQPLLYQIDASSPQYEEAKRLLKLLDYILPVPSEDINNNSIFREFIGGSCFNV